MTMTVLPQRDELGVGGGKLLIDGAWVDGSEGEQWTHLHPATGEEVGGFAIASAGDVDRALAAARRAFDDGGWTSMQARDRKRLLQRCAELVGEHAAELNQIQALDNGMPVGVHQHLPALGRHGRRHLRLPRRAGSTGSPARPCPTTRAAPSSP